MPHRPHNVRALSKPKHIQKSHHKHYWPYFPMLLMIGTIFVSTVTPRTHHGVLAYATSMSTTQLLSATNSQRQQNGAGALTAGQQLTAAAQAKANDMIARNYWSHNTPDGQEPWIFMDNAGYKYVKAGENLAYGFNSSDDTVTGWMNSPTHRSNLLDAEFTEVGFGFANGAEYNSSGPETIVVAMYGKPQVLAANTTQAPAETLPVSATQQAVTPKSASSTITDVPSATQQPVKNTPVSKIKGTFITTDKPLSAQPPAQHVSRVQTLTGGRAPWSLFAVGLLSGLVAMFLLFKHTLGIRHLIRDSERFVMHHPLLDSILICLIAFGSFLSQTKGIIR